MGTMQVEQSTGLFQFLDNVVPTQSQILCLVSYDGTIQQRDCFISYKR
jgi:hypothetical protein